MIAVRDNKGDFAWFSSAVGATEFPNIEKNNGEAWDYVL